METEAKLSLLISLCSLVVITIFGALSFCFGFGACKDNGAPDEKCVPPTTDLVSVAVTTTVPLTTAGTGSAFRTTEIVSLVFGIIALLGVVLALISFCLRHNLCKVSAQDLCKSKGKAGRKTRDAVYESVKERLPALSSKNVSDVVKRLKDVGVDSEADLHLVEADDLQNVLKPIQIRKILQAWHQKEPKSSDNAQLATLSLSTPLATETEVSSA